MTTDELKKEAEESFEKYRVTDIDYVVSPYSEDEGEKRLMFNNEYDAEEEYFRLYSKGYLASAEPREKRIAELEARCNELFLQTCEQAELIEKMKCCGNCKNEGDYKEPYRYGTGWCNICKRHKVAKGNFDKWEIKEK